MTTTTPSPIRPGQTMTGPLFAEPMRVETVQANGPASWVVDLRLGITLHMRFIHPVLVLWLHLATLVSLPAQPITAAGRPAQLDIRAAGEHNIRVF